MQRQVEHILRLIDDLLDLSRVMQGKIQLRKEPVDLGLLATNSLAEIRPECESQRRHLSSSLPAQPVWVEGDPVRLSQILANLFSNAPQIHRSREQHRVDSGARRQASDAHGVGLRRRDSCRHARADFHAFYPGQPYGRSGAWRVGNRLGVSAQAARPAWWNNRGAQRRNRQRKSIRSAATQAAGSHARVQACLEAVGGSSQARAGRGRQSRRGHVPRPAAAKNLEARRKDRA